MRDLILLSGLEPAVQDQRLMRFAASMGISTKTVLCQDGRPLTGRLLDEFQPAKYCLAVSAKTLAGIFRDPILAEDLRRLINDHSEGLLVFGCTASAEQLNAISRLTSGAVSGITPLDDQPVCFTFPRDAVSFSRQLAGLSFSRRQGEQLSTFELRNSASDAARVIIAANQPVFLRIKSGACEVFLWAGALPDIDEPLSRDHGLQDHYDRLIPALIFLRHCFQDSCWHGPKSTARLIIDDPLLAEKYGFLDCGALIKSMQRSKYGTSIAFIPWNYWRTSRRNTSRLFGESSNLAICIHGCDHTNKEFDARDPALLTRKAGLALHRMEAQKKRTGTEFEQVMVFPQGLFSTAAIAALRANNYLAAVNTTCFPTNIGPNDLKVGDLLRPAVTRYDGFPIFQRQYPRHLFDCAFDLFLGRPALVVEHHEYFRDGYTTWEGFVAELYKLEPTLSWPSLTDQLTRSCLKRCLSNGSVAVQFFTRRFQLVNREPTSVRFALKKQEPDSSAIERVTIDGSSTDFSFEQGFLKLEVDADPDQVRNIEIIDRVRPHLQPNGFGVAHNTGVLLRRGLSEFRDNTLVRHGRLLKVAQGIVKGLKVTGDA